MAELLVAAGAGVAVRVRPRRAALEADSRAARDVEPRRVRKVGIVGAGLMATQLATLFLRRLEVPVVLRDLDAGARRRGARLDPRRDRGRSPALRRGQGAIPRRARRAAATG